MLFGGRKSEYISRAWLHLNSRWSKLTQNTMDVVSSLWLNGVQFISMANIHVFIWLAWSKVGDKAWATDIFRLGLNPGRVTRKPWQKALVSCPEWHKWQGAGGLIAPPPNVKLGLQLGFISVLAISWFSVECCFLCVLRCFFSGGPGFSISIHNQVHHLLSRFFLRVGQTALQTTRDTPNGVRNRIQWNQNQYSQWVTATKLSNSGTASAHRMAASTAWLQRLRTCY